MATSPLVTALIAGFAAAAPVGIAVVGFMAESRRIRHDRRQEYLVASASDLATRVWQAMRRVGELKGGAVTFESLYEELVDLRVGMLGQVPRYRLAGVNALAEHVAELLQQFLSRWSLTDGAVRSHREMAATLQSMAGDPKATALVAELPWTIDDVDAAVEATRDRLVDHLRDNVRGALMSLSTYDPKGDDPPLSVDQPDVRWANFSDVLKEVSAERRPTAG